MSAELLEDVTKANELADDRESCLYVLTWTALCYTKHTIKDRTLNDLLRGFYYAYKAGDLVTGGCLKRVSLLFREIPERVRFDGRPHLDNLISDLTRALAVRYEPLLSPSYMELTRFEIFMDHRNTRMDSLKRRGWLVEIFKRHLDAGPWPTLDEAVK
jgi:hypothetical protein